MVSRTVDFLRAIAIAKRKGYDAINMNLDLMPEVKIYDKETREYLEPWRYAQRRGILVSTYTLQASTPQTHLRKLPHHNPDFYMSDDPVELHSMYDR